MKEKRIIKSDRIMRYIKIQNGEMSNPLNCKILNFIIQRQAIAASDAAVKNKIMVVL